jgi:ribosomal-protein-serine acetyltransferase
MTTSTPNTPFTPIDPLLADVPQQLETERLLLCAPQAGLGTILNNAITESHTSLKRWFTWAQTLPTVEETEKNIRQAVVRFHQREQLQFFLFKKEDGVFMGMVGLHPLDWKVPSFTLGYWVSTKFEGKGYVTEAVNGVVHFAFKVLKAKRVQIECDARNHRSSAVAERAGFLYEGTRHWDSRDVEGKLCDTLVYVKFG